MMLTIDRKWLTKRNACKDGKEFYLANCSPELDRGIVELTQARHGEWAWWLLQRYGVLTHLQAVRIAIYAARMVLPVYERKHPDNKLPRQAIAAAKKWLKDPTSANAIKAHAAAWAAWAADMTVRGEEAAARAAIAAAWAAWATDGTARAATDAAARTANAAADATVKVIWGANAVANAAAWAADMTVRANMELRIIRYAARVLREGDRS